MTATDPRPALAATLAARLAPRRLERARSGGPDRPEAMAATSPHDKT